MRHMLEIVARGLTRNADGAPAGGGGGTGTTTPPSGGTTTPPAAASGAPAEFDWGKVGMSDDTMPIVKERGWKHPNDVITSYRNLEKLTGQLDKIIKMPVTNDPKEWNEFYTKLGRPESADKYTIPVPEGDKGEFAGLAKGWFHEAGISQAQATKLAEKWNGHIAEQQKTAQTKAEQANQIQLNELKQAWGANYDANAAVVDNAAATFGMSDEQVLALKQVLGVKGAMTFLHTIGSKLGVEDKNPAGMGGGGAGDSLTPQQAQAEIARLKKDPDFVKLFSSADPKARMEAREKMSRLQRLAAPGITNFASAGVKA